jgi:hypothetical protein
MIGRSAAGLVSSFSFRGNRAAAEAAVRQIEAEFDGEIEIKLAAEGELAWVISLCPLTQAEYIGADLSLRGRGLAYCFDGAWWFEPAPSIANQCGFVVCSQVDLGDLRFVGLIQEAA